MPAPAFAPPGSRELVFLFDVVSPFSCLVAHRIDARAEAHGVTVRWQPVFLGGLLKGSQNSTPITAGIASKIRWQQRDLYLQAQAYGVTVQWPDSFPQNTLTAMRALSAVEEPGSIGPAARACFELIFGKGGTAEDTDALATALSSTGLDGVALVQQAREDAVKNRLRAATDLAVEWGAFGVPTQS